MYDVEHKTIRKGPLPLDRNGYQWPASALGSYEMSILYHLRKKTGKPITVCLKNLVLAAEKEVMNDKKKEGVKSPYPIKDKFCGFQGSLRR